MYMAKIDSVDINGDQWHVSDEIHTTHAKMVGAVVYAYVPGRFLNRANAVDAAALILSAANINIVGAARSISHEIEAMAAENSFDYAEFTRALRKFPVLQAKFVTLAAELAKLDVVRT